MSDWTLTAISVVGAQMKIVRDFLEPKSESFRGSIDNHFSQLAADFGYPSAAEFKAGFTNAHLEYLTGLTKPETDGYAIAGASRGESYSPKIVQNSGLNGPSGGRFA